MYNYSYNNTVISLFFIHKFPLQIFCVELILEWRNRQKIFPIYIFKNLIDVWEHSGAIAVEGSASGSDPLGSGI